MLNHNIVVHTMIEDILDFASSNAHHVYYRNTLLQDDRAKRILKRLTEMNIELLNYYKIFKKLDPDDMKRLEWTISKLQDQLDG